MNLVIVIKPKADPRVMALKEGGLYDLEHSRQKGEDLK
jgi:hypothetical protein